MVELLTLGSVTLRVDGEPLVRLSGHKKKLALMAYVALEGPVARERLLTMFWPESDERHSRHALSQSLFSLKEEIGVDPFKIEGDLIALDHSTAQIDALELEVSAAEERWYDALEIYGGAFFENFFLPQAPSFEQWQSMTSLRLTRVARGAFSAVVAGRRSAGDADGAIAVTQRWATLEPLAEEAHHLLIELLAQSGKRLLAIREFDLFEKRLQDELGLAPSDETVELIEEIRGGHAPRASDDSIVTRVDAAKHGAEDEDENAFGKRYALERELPTSLGVAKVYLARDRRHDRNVAVKLLRRDVTPSVNTERFLREINMAAQLNHPHVVPIYDSGTSEGSLYYVMPYIEGATLREKLNQQGRLEIEEALSIIKQVASGAAHAHSRGIVHRELKPENILLYEDHAYITDFGIARAMFAAGSTRLTETGVVLGSPEYMSPEQTRGSSKLDGRSDIYSMGCVLFEMLAGYPPFTGASPQIVKARHINDPLPSVKAARPEVPDAIVSALNCALAKTPHERFETATQFAEALTVS